MEGRKEGPKCVLVFGASYTGTIYYYLYVRILHLHKNVHTSMILWGHYHNY